MLLQTFFVLQPASQPASCTGEQFASVVLWNSGDESGCSQKVVNSFAELGFRGVSEFVLY
jgi:hypothetical protein